MANSGKLTHKHEILARRNLEALALRVVDKIPAMIAYWNTDLRCVFANDAYLHWFGRTRKSLLGRRISELLGPELYAKNLPYMQRALAGERQEFERDIRLPNGEIRNSLAIYLPDVVDGKVQGFVVQVADVTALKRLERELTVIKAKGLEGNTPLSKAGVKLDE